MKEQPANPFSSKGTFSFSASFDRVLLLSASRSADDGDDSENAGEQVNDRAFLGLNWRSTWKHRSRWRRRFFFLRRSVELDRTTNC